jgi:hypothetical protein
MAEAAVFADFGRLAVGGLISIGGADAPVGLGLHLAAGPRFRVSERVRIDLLGDVGLVFLSSDESSGSFGSSEPADRQTLPAAGVRAGVTFTGRESGRYVTVGAGIRHVSRRTVSFTVQDCPLFGACRNRTETETYGGTVAGGFLTFGRAHRRTR